MIKKRLGKLFTGEMPEGPIEAGQTLGMSPEMVLKKYLVRRNALLSLLRIYRKLSLSEVAERLGISEDELDKIEKSDTLVPYQLALKFAEIFRVDLRSLLVLLQHIKSDAKDDKSREFKLLGVAAQYSGPELTEQEKVDLEELIKMILENVKAKKGKNSK